jgi:hypothetical protein
MARKTRPALFDLLRDGLGTARADADRILRELSERGHLSGEEVVRYERKIGRALRESHELLEERIAPTLRAVVRELVGERADPETAETPSSEESEEG